jgi:methylglutaconyl-CoA hydratase
MPTYETLLVESDAAASTITFNRPDKRNAITPKMIEEFAAALKEVETHPARAVILTGAGKAFCSGMDLEQLIGFSAHSPAENLELSRRLAALFRSIWMFPKPTIAAVNGAAVGGGCGIATLCDFTLSVPEAKFGYPEVRAGYIPAIVSVFLIRQIGEKRARNLLLSGRIFGAEEALSLGMITEVVPPQMLLATARQLAQSLRGCSPASLQKTKRLLYDFISADLNRELELAAAESAEIRTSADFQEGLASFLEKRPPRWSGE